MADRPSVSVLMPIHNGEPTLTEAVESVLAQTFGDFELIAVDDGSTDSSLAKLQSFARRDPRGSNPQPAQYRYCRRAERFHSAGPR